MLDRTQVGSRSGAVAHEKASIGNNRDGAGHGGSADEQHRVTVKPEIGLESAAGRAPRG